MLKPSGTSTVIVVVPVLWAWNVVFAWVALLPKDIGLIVITPTSVFELVTGTLTGLMPPRSAWFPSKARFGNGVSRAGLTLMLVLEPGVVVMLRGLLM